MSPGAGKPSKAEQVRGLLMDEIMAGRLRPGDKLVEEEVAARLRCSRTPVREALRHLDAIGLVQFRPRHGATVAGPAPRALLDLCDAMAELESACAELAATRLSGDDRDRLRALEASGGGEEEMLDILRAASGNSVLAELARTVRSRWMPHWRRSVDGSEAKAVAAAGLRPVIEAVVSGDGMAARAAMRAHVERLARLPQLP